MPNSALVTFSALMRVHRTFPPVSPFGVKISSALAREISR